jgi:hypothetical protein
MIWAIIPQGAALGGFHPAFGMMRAPRQAGKTWLINQFCRTEYENTAYVNFETNRRIASFFDDDISPKRLLSLIAGALGKR